VSNFSNEEEPSNTTYPSIYTNENLTFPTLQNDGLRWAFIRGYVDGNNVFYGYNRISCQETNKVIKKWVSIHGSTPFLKTLGDFTKVPYELKNNDRFLEFTGLNCLDFLGKLYSNVNIYDERHKVDFFKNEEVLKFSYVKTDEKAIPPQKSRFTDSGFDLHLIKKIKEVGGVLYYDTGISVKPPSGYYFEVVGRSSISKSGFTLANNLGIIDAGYTGSIIVALLKVDENAKELELPCKLVQLLPRKLYLMEAVETKKN